MEIKLGHGLDGLKPKISVSTIGIKEVGPVGFLAILETQCGIAPIVDSPTTRIIQYLACLKACDTPERFYHRSFAVDQFNVAKTLLNWRDTWYESGWNGLFTENVFGRLQDMADVERFAQKKVSFGFGQRQQLVLATLKTQKTQIKQVILLDPLTDFSPLWQQILQLFTLAEHPARLFPSQSDTDLSRLQTTLVQLSTENLRKGENGSITKIKLKGDNSFLVLKARSKAISARLISQWLATQTHNVQTKTVALLTGSEGIELDDALASVDLPRLGFVKTSPWRPVLQVLPIALELFWEPLNPQVLLQFLMHPVGLLPGRIRHPLAKVVADAPGIGGGQWQHTLTSLLEKEKDRKSYSTERYQKLETDLKYWFASDRYRPEQGLPLAIAKQRILKVQTWLAQKQSGLDDEAMRALFGAAHSQASELNSALINLMADGIDVIKPEQLRYLLDQLTGAGTAIVDQYPEVIGNQAKFLVGATQPDSFIENHNTVVWWDLQASSSPTTYPWSRQELCQLNDQGVLLPNLEELIQKQALSWLKPINAAQERLVIVLHDSNEGHHPLWDQISSCLENWQEIRVENTVLDEHTINAFNQLLTVQSPYSPLPTLSRYWELETGVALGARDQESYSSLENFFYSPYQWVLHYKAKLRAGTLQSLSDGNLLKGNLVHHLYERFFNVNTSLLSSSDYEKEVVDLWFDDAIKNLLIEEGAVLLQPGRLVEKEYFISTTRQSLHNLIHQLRRAKVVKVEMELHQEALFFGGHLGGYIDMTVTNDEGKEAVVDIKWGGAKYRKASLKDNKHLQLVTYSYMRHKNSATRQWPTVAYFVIESGGVMLVQNTDFFPAALVVKPINDDNQAVIWQKMKETWQWRRNQLDRGLIEVSVTGTEVVTDLQPSEEGLDIPETSDRFNDYKVLTGWMK